jgi:uncharacterized protein YndB with AHSA1/START domain
MSNTQTTAPSLTINRTFNASRERVFDAFITPSVIRQWFGGTGVNVSDVTFDARNGGSYRILMKNSSGEDYNARGTITEFRKPERLAYTFRWEEDDPQTERDTFITIDFIARGNQTEMIFTHENLASETSRDNHTEGWNNSFDQMATLL